MSRYYEVYVLCDTLESRKYDSLHVDDDDYDITPRDLLVKQLMMLNADKIVSFMPDKDSRCTHVDCGNMDTFILAKKYVDFLSMVVSKKYIEV
jgi:hypothetical protein